MDVKGQEKTSFFAFPYLFFATPGMHKRLKRQDIRIFPNVPIITKTPRIPCQLLHDSLQIIKKELRGYSWNFPLLPEKTADVGSYGDFLKLFLPAAACYPRALYQMCGSTK